MIEIWSKSAKSNISQKPADQERLVWKKSWFYDIEILEYVEN